MPESLVPVDAAPVELEPPRSQAPAAPEPSRTPAELPLPVLVLVDEARKAATEAERQEKAERLNALLRQMGRGGGSREVADVLHGLLDGGKLAGLVDARDRTCRAVATEALLELGFPYALEVRPEDLEHLRGASTTSRPGSQKGQRKKQVALAALLTGVLGEIALALGRAEANPAVLVPLLGFILFPLVAVLSGRPQSALHRLGVVVLAVVSALGVLVSLGGHGGLVAGLAGLLAAFLFARQES